MALILHAALCGRFLLSADPQAVANLFSLPNIPRLTPRYNVAPSQSIAAVRDDGGVRSLAWLRWGLVPSRADDPKIGFRLINARAETVATKPTFRSAFKRRRCLVAADGFYEWLHAGTKKKQPYHFRLREHSVFALAGL